MIIAVIIACGAVGAVALVLNAIVYLFAPTAEERERRERMAAAAFDRELRADRAADWSRGL